MMASEESKSSENGLKEIVNIAMDETKQLSEVFFVCNYNYRILKEFIEKKNVAVAPDVYEKYIRGFNYNPKICAQQNSNQKEKHIYNYFSDHRPVVEEHENIVIITWNIGVGDNNAPQPYQDLEKKIRKYITRQDGHLYKYKNYDVYKNNTVNHLALIVFNFIKKIIEYRKPVVVHLQECSFDVYNKISEKISENIPSVYNYSGNFMPKIIAKVKKDNDNLRTKLYYDFDLMKYYNLKENILGYTSFVFAEKCNLSMFPSSTRLFFKKDKQELKLQSRLCMVKLNIDDIDYIHYNLHNPKRKKAETERDYYMKLINMIDVYNKNIFINIEDETKKYDTVVEADSKENIEICTIRDFKARLLKDIPLSKNRPFINIEDGNLKVVFYDSNTFNFYPQSRNRFMCGDFNYFICNLRKDLISRIDIKQKSGVDYIVKLADTTPDLLTVSGFLVVFHNSIASVPVADASVPVADASVPVADASVPVAASILNTTTFTPVATASIGPRRINPDKKFNEKFIILEDIPGRNTINDNQIIELSEGIVERTFRDPVDSKKKYKIKIQTNDSNLKMRKKYLDMIHLYGFGEIQIISIKKKTGDEFIQFKSNGKYYIIFFENKESAAKIKYTKYINYELKYLKYKEKYLSLKKQLGL